MDVLKINREIGLFLACENIAKVLNSSEVVNKVGAEMPLPKDNLTQNVGKITDWLSGFNKSKYMFLNPEIALIERFTNSQSTEAIIVEPCDMDDEIRTRLKDNLPQNVKVTILQEPFFPKRFRPDNGIIVVTGYLAGNKTMVLPETLRMINHYKNFWGKIVFVPYVVVNDYIRCGEWMEVSSSIFNEIWR
ncbi:MAG: hypothetical protein K6F77_09185 [Lachnospiraceae bacterium]|nr:hypothetical protein [Lachnospiraceae bacterium]